MRRSIYARLTSTNDKSSEIKKETIQEKFVRRVNELMEENYKSLVQERQKEGIRNYWKNKKLKAVGYVRISSPKQQQEGHSIQAQKRLLQEFAERKGYEIIEFFEDCDSAINSSRIGHRKMYSYLGEHGEVKHVLSKASRLHRNCQCSNL